MRNRLSLFFICMMVSTGCVETIMMDSHEKDARVAVNCILKGENLAYHVWESIGYSPSPQKQSMTIRYVKGKSEKDYIPVEDALVYIKYVSGPSQEESTLSFSHQGNGIWESDRAILIEPGTEYTLYVEMPGRETIWAKTVSPPRLSVLVNPSEKVLYDSEELYLHQFKFAGRENNLDGYSVWIYGQEYSSGVWVDFDYLVTNHPYADDFNINEMHFSDLAISGDLEDSRDTSFCSFFEGARTLKPELPLHDRFIRIYDLDSDNYSFIIGGPLWYLNIENNDFFGRDKWSNLGYSDCIRFQCHLLSKELDEYLRSIYIYERSLDSYLTAVYSNPNIHSNIHGGIGIFGCDSWSITSLFAPGGVPPAIDFITE